MEKTKMRHAAVQIEDGNLRSLGTATWMSSGKRQRIRKYEKWNFVTYKVNKTESYLITEVPHDFITSSEVSTNR